MDFLRPSFGGKNGPNSHVLEKEHGRWKDFRKGLNKEDQQAFDRLFDRAKFHTAAGVYMANPYPLETILVSIILPQAIGVTLPPLLGQAIVLVKDSALLSLISLPELTRAGQIMTSERFMPAEGFLTSAVFYLLIYYILKGLTHWSQKRLIYMQT